MCYELYSLFQNCNDVAFVSVEDTNNSIDSGQQHESTLPSMICRLIIMNMLLKHDISFEYLKSVRNVNMH